MHQLLEKNLAQDLWFYDPKSGNCYFFPQGWAEFFGQDGFVGSEEESELYGYYPTHNIPNSPVDTGYVEAGDMDSCREVTEAEARKLHPALAEHLDEINLLYSGGAQ